MKDIRYILISFLIFVSVSIFGQYDTINKFNSKGEKTGYWKVFLDKNLNPVDSSKAFFYGYDLYDNGEPLSKFERSYKYLGQGKTTFDGKLAAKGHPQLLEGTLLIYNKYGDLIEETRYKNGSFLFIKLYENNLKYSSSILYEAMYFHTECPGSIYAEEYNNGKLTGKVWVYLENKKWKKRKIKCA